MREETSWSPKLRLAISASPPCGRALSIGELNFNEVGAVCQVRQVQIMSGRTIGENAADFDSSHVPNNQLAHGGAMVMDKLPCVGLGKALNPSRRSLLQRHTVANVLAQFVEGVDEQGIPHCENIERIGSVMSPEVTSETAHECVVLGDFVPSG